MSTEDKLNYFKEKGIIEEQDGLLINKSAKHINYFTILSEIKDNYWRNCVPENVVSDLSVNIIQLFIECSKKLGLLFDCAYENNYNLYFVCKCTDEKFIRPHIGEPLMFQNNNIIMELNLSNCVVYDCFRQEYYTVFKEIDNSLTLRASDHGNTIWKTL